MQARLSHLLRWLRQRWRRGGSWHQGRGREHPARRAAAVAAPPLQRKAVRSPGPGSGSRGCYKGKRRARRGQALGRHSGSSGCFPRQACGCASASSSRLGTELAGPKARGAVAKAASLVALGMPQRWAENGAPCSSTCFSAAQSQRRKPRKRCSGLAPEKKERAQRAPLLEAAHGWAWALGWAGLPLAGKAGTMPKNS